MQIGNATPSREAVDDKPIRNPLVYAPDPIVIRISFSRRRKLQSLQSLPWLTSGGRRRGRLTWVIDATGGECLSLQRSEAVQSCQALSRGISEQIQIGSHLFPIGQSAPTGPHDLHLLYGR
jgi:hypothetical protein